MTKVKAEQTDAREGPFPNFVHPSPEDCRRARDSLAELHEQVTNERLKNNGTLLETGCNRVTHSSVLDSLVRTILSQNTTDSTSARAFRSLKENFPTWESVMASESGPVEDAVRVGGLAEIKVARIKTILQTLVEERGTPPTMEYLRGMSDENAKAELTRFKGVGPKTASCVLMFCLDRNDFPVDTHVWHIAHRLGWVPPRADREQTYEHLNRRVPDDVKFDLHILLVEHGKCCRTCAKGGRLVKTEVGPCCLVRVGATSPQSAKTETTMHQGTTGGGSPMHVKAEKMESADDLVKEDAQSPPTVKAERTVKEHSAAADASHKKKKGAGAKRKLEVMKQCDISAVKIEVKSEPGTVKAEPGTVKTEGGTGKKHVTVTNGRATRQRKLA